MKYYIAILLALNPYFIHAQKHGQARVDSLLKELPLAKEDTGKVNILDKLSFEYSNIDPREGIRYGQNAMNLAEKLGWKRGIAIANADLGVNYETLSDHSKALDYDLKAIKLYEQQNNKSNIAGTTVNMGQIYLAQSDYPKTLECYFKALEIYEELDNKKYCAVVLGNIGSVYFEQKEYSQTEKYYTEALKISQALGDKEAVTRNLGNIGIVQDAKGNYTKALEYHQEALAANKKLGNKNFIQINLANIGYVYCHLKNYTEALAYQQMALKISQELGNKNSIAINYGNIGETCLNIVKDTVNSPNTSGILSKSKIEYLQKAIWNLEKAVSICKEINYSAPLVEFSQYLSEAYFLSSSYKKAFDNLKLYTTVKDSVYSIQNKIQIANIETQREIELKNKDLLIKDKLLRIKKLEITQKRYEHTLYIISTILLALVAGIVLTSLYFYRKSNRRLLKEKRHHLAVIEAQINHIKAQTDVLEQISQMQSHDVRGPVATILGLVELFNHEDVSDPVNKVVIEGVGAITEKLDKAVQEVIKKENSLNS